MSFGSDPGRDDGSLPPVNMVIPDDARELERDVIAYRRELRARRRRARLARVTRPLRGHAAVLPLIAACVAIAMLAGTMFSLVTITPASAPTLSASPPAPAASGTAGPASPVPRPRTAGPMPPTVLSVLPAGTFSVGGSPRPIPTLKTAAVALIPADCGCDQALNGLARAADTAKTSLYFVGEGQGIAQVPEVTRRDGRGVAASASDISGVFSRAYHPASLTVLLVYSDRTARVVRGAAAASRIGLPALRVLARPGR